jgi:L-arabinonolactonase
MNIRIRFVGTRRNLLGESPLWDPVAQRLYWVDSVARQICCTDADGGNYSVWDMPEIVGSIGLTRAGLVAALRDGFYSIDFATGNVVAIALPEKGSTEVRFNDGKADRQGRFLAGTMRMHEAAAGRLYRLDPDGRCTVLERDILIANSLCFSPSGDRMYFADSLQGVIWEYHYDVASGTVSDRRTLIDTRVFGSAPDGATVDAEGCLWVALVQSQQIARFDPRGVLIQIIDMPVPFPSCPAFGGSDLRTLFVTTVSDSHNLLRSDHPDAGRVLAIEGLNVAGLVEARCRFDSSVRTGSA